MIDRKDIFPLRSGVGEGRIGVVFGNGSSLDEVSDKVWKKASGDEFLTVGCNRIGLSSRMREADFVPDVVLMWDAPHRGGKLINQEICDSLQYCADCGSWVVNVFREGLPKWPLVHQYVRYIPNNTEYPYHFEHCVHSGHNVGDGAANLLYRLGCRDVYLYGIDLDGPYCRMVTRDKQQVAWNKIPKAGPIMAWQYQLNTLPKLRVWCASKKSVLVKKHYLPFGCLGETDAD